MKVRDLIEHLERVEETVGNVLAVVDSVEGPGFVELNQISLVKVEPESIRGSLGTYFRVHDDDTRGRQAVRLHAVISYKS